jgi:hypothetical protein
MIQLTQQTAKIINILNSLGTIKHLWKLIGDIHKAFGEELSKISGH